MASYRIKQQVQMLKIYYQNDCSLVGTSVARKIIFSDEAHFWMNGYVNKQNCHNWDDAIPQVAMHSQKITVWCGF